VTYHVPDVPDSLAQAIDALEILVPRLYDAAERAVRRSPDDAYVEIRAHIFIMLQAAEEALAEPDPADAEPERASYRIFLVAIAHRLREAIATNLEVMPHAPDSDARHEAEQAAVEAAKRALELVVGLTAIYRERQATPVGAAQH
jgi:hypothetical protein